MSAVLTADEADEAADAKKTYRIC